MARTLTNFNGGLFSSYLKGRIELEKYNTALQAVSNYHILKYGALQNRAGTTYIGDRVATDMRLIPFQYNVKNSNVLVFYNGLLDIIKGNDVVNTNPIATPYTNEQLFGIQYYQVGDIMYLVHPDVPVQKLLRESETDWSIAPVTDLNHAPFLEPNKSETTLTPSGTNGTITVTASANLFEPSHVGRSIQFKQVRTDNIVGAGGGWINVSGKWSFSTRGEWTGEAKIFRSDDGGVTSQQFKQFSSSGANNYMIDNEEKADHISMSVTAPSGCTAQLIVDDFYSYGVAEITGYTSPTEVTATVIDSINSATSTIEWSFNAFSADTGYPTAITIHNERLVLGGTYAQPSTVFMSKIDGWENFKTANSIISGITFKLNTNETIQWFNEERDSLIIGTTGQEYKVVSKSKDKPFNADNMESLIQSADGSVNIQSKSVGSANIFVARDRKRVRAMGYNFESDSLKSEDLCALSGTEFIESGIREFEYKQNPYSELYFVLGNGQVAILTYDKEQNVFGWSLFDMKGKIKSICVLKGSSTDELYFAVEREINNTTKIFIERMADRNFQSREEWFFLDCGYNHKYDVPTSTVTGLDWLEGEEVSIEIDGDLRPNQVVNNGELTLDKEGTNVKVGIPYVSYVQIMDIDDMQGKQSDIPARKKLNKLYVKLRNTVGFYAGADLEGLEFIKLHSTSGVWYNNINAVTDIVTINIASRHSEEYAPYFGQVIPQAQEILGYAGVISK